MKTPQSKIFKELTYSNPQNRDAGQYWDMADDMLKDKNHPAWRYISDGLREQLNPKK
jgi:hypothetical protein